MMKQTNRRTRWMSRLAAQAFSGLLLIGGVASCTAPVGQAHRPAIERVEPWVFEGHSGKAIHTPSFVVYTTLDDEEVLTNLARVLEGAIDQYRLWAPNAPLTPEPMSVYLFKYRNQWANFTRLHTGADAVVYLQIMRGGYTVGDWSASYFLGDLSTYTVSAHEGWHQFVARHFRDRLPPFLEEGIACTFESLTVTDRNLTWHSVNNANRATKLKAAMDAGAIVPLDRLISLHAGEVVDQGMERIEGFYAQCWAFARFLRDAEGGRYRPALQRLLGDAVVGKLYDPTRSPLTPRGAWRPQSVQPMLEHYLGMTLPEIDERYQAYMKEIVARQQ